MSAMEDESKMKCLVGRNICILRKATRLAHLGDSQKGGGGKWNITHEEIFKSLQMRRLLSMKAKYMGSRSYGAS